ncbi:MAG: LysM peptidoglycan-binding domain-containing protein [Balneolaceae bacterium]
MKYLTPLFILLFAFSMNLSAQEKKSYTVKEGETLYGISKLLEVSVAELQEWNNIDDSGISIGQELIYYVKEVEEPPAEPVRSLVNISNPAENTFYIVKSGDNLYTIARFHNMTLEELKTLNELTSDVLRIGQRLSVKKISVAPSVSEFSEESSPQGSFAIYTVERGQTLTDILTKFKMTERELQELNPEISVVALDRGQQITVLLPPSRSYDNPYLNNANLQDLGTVGASLYNDSELGNATTNGELYNPEELTAAHSNIALGSIIFIENSETKSGIYVRINDRITDSGLKLSAKAFRILGLENSGNPTVTIYTDS